MRALRGCGEWLIRRETPFAPAAIDTPVAFADPNHRVLGFSLAALVFGLDQLVKWVVTVPLQLQRNGVRELFAFFDLRWVENNGVSMGMLTADTETGRWLLVALTATIAIGVRSGCGAKGTATMRPRSPWFSAARSAISSIASVSAMLSTSPICISASGGHF